MPWDKTPASMTEAYGRILPIASDAWSISNLPDESFARSENGLTWKTLFCASKTPTNTFTCGVAKCVPKVGELHLHRHKAAELYHNTPGTGLVEIDGVEHPARTGNVFFVPSNAGRRVRNTSETEELTWLYVFAVDSFGSVMYQWQNDSSTPRQSRL